MAQHTSQSAKAIYLLSALFLASVFASTSVTKAQSQTKKATPNEIVTSSLAQRPSEINRIVKGRVTRTGEVYLLRGLANVWSRGMDTIGEKMVRQGMDARVYNHSIWRELADNIVARAKVKKVSYPIIIMGHSLGANASTMMAKYLGDKGIRVEYVVTFDPTITTFVGKNVKRVINFYLPNDSKSNVVRKASGFRGTLKNINVRGTRGITHTTIEKDKKFQTDVINRALTYTKKRRKKRS